MTKEEKIQEAYGEHYTKLKKYLCENGWFNQYKCRSDLDFVLTRYFSIGELDRKLIRFRPKSLQGIENNNGWIKIESEDDLPKKGITCHFILKSGVTGIFTNLDDSEYLTLKNRATHYQPIQKPKPPIY